MPDLSSQNNEQEKVKGPERTEPVKVEQVVDNPAVVARAAQEVSALPGDQTPRVRLERLATDNTAPEKTANEITKPNEVQRIGELVYFNKLCQEVKQGTLSPANLAEYTKGLLVLGIPRPEIMTIIRINDIPLEITQYRKDELQKFTLTPDEAETKFTNAVLAFQKKQISPVAFQGFTRGLIGRGLTREQAYQIMHQHMPDANITRGSAAGNEYRLDVGAIPTEDFLNAALSFTADNGHRYLEYAKITNQSEATVYDAMEKIINQKIVAAKALRSSAASARIVQGMEVSLISSMLITLDGTNRLANLGKPARARRDLMAIAAKVDFALIDAKNTNKDGMRGKVDANSAQLILNFIDAL